MIDAGTKNGEMRRGPRAAQLDAGVLDHRQAADAGTDDDADALGVLLGDRQAAVVEGLDARGDAVMDERIHVARFLRRDVLLDVEALDLAGDATGQRRRVEARDRVDARPAGEDVGPRFGDRVADRRDDAEAGDDDATATHACHAGDCDGRRTDHFLCELT